MSIKREKSAAFDYKAGRPLSTEGRMRESMSIGSERIQIGAEMHKTKNWIIDTTSYMTAYMMSRMMQTTS